MKRGHIIAIIAIASVLIFFLLSYAFPNIPAWIVFIAAGLGIMIASSMKNKDGGSKG